MAKLDNTKVANIENTKAAIEQEKELTQSETINAWMSAHAVEHYCAALGESEQETKELLTKCEAKDGQYYLYTQPAIGGKRSDNTPNPTREEWEKLNPTAIFVTELACKYWYKRLFSIGDARGVRSIINGYTNYQKAVDGAEKKVENTLAAAAALLGIDVETLKAMKAK